MEHAVSRFMRAHGHMPGPTQRPRTAGAISGVIAGLSAAPVLWRMDSITAISRSLGMAGWAVLALFLVSMLLLGGLYGQIFGRGANDRRGGWLLGLGYGFLLWLIGPVAVLQWLLPGGFVVGLPAMGLAAGQTLYGLVLGLVYPYVHDLIQRELHAI